ncbi:MAG: CHASE2 domain-containing protein [Alphaproteobacteria bacterium]
MQLFHKVTPKGWKFIHFSFLFILLITAVLFSDSNHPVRVELQHTVFDQFNKLHPRKSSQQVVIVDIDEKSLEHIGQWPWPRNVMADLVQSLSEKGAKVIAFDGVFGEEDRASPHYFLQHVADTKLHDLADSIDINDMSYNYDAQFAAAIKKSKIFVTAFTYGRAERTNNSPLDKKRILARSDVKEMFKEHASHFEAAAVNLYPFAKSAAGNGSFMAKPDDDGILRRVGMVFTDGTTIFPSLSLEALRVAHMGRKGTIKLVKVPADERKEIDTDYRILVGDMKIPVENDGILYVRYRHFCNKSDVARLPTICQGQDYVSAHKFLNSDFAEEAGNAVKDKIVLIGASAEGLKDLRSTALRPFRPGVEVHANVIEQVLTGEYLQRPLLMKGAEALFVLGAGLFFITMAPFIGVITSVVLCVSIVCVAAFGAYWAYVEHGLLIDPVYPSLAVVVIFLVSTVLSYARAEMKRKQIRSAFRMYVAPDVMRDLEKNPEKLTLGGEIRDLTVMFTDIRRFTSISEGLSPEELIQMMNDFLTNMTDIVMEHEGTVDKYIGDAMMAFWNAPKDVENHEREACLAALNMQSALEPINEKVIERAKEKGVDPILLKAGIGINTGPCAIGNMGSKQRFAYSALGDAVNLSARLEGQTKTYGVGILVGESSYEQASDLAMLELDVVRVIGKEKPVRIFGLFGDDKYACGAMFENWKILHNEMLCAYRKQDFKIALQVIDKCREISDEQGEALYDGYVERIEQLKEQGLPKDWDGAFIAQSK